MKTQSTSNQPKGFALIATISVMVLLVMVALAMLSLSTIELRASQNGRAMAEAQANARVALMMAIGELQKQLGPDQRISITADQRSDPSGDGGETSAAIGNRYWTGVFDSWTSASDTRPSPEFRSWLISGDPSRVSEVALSDTALSNDGTIELVGEGTVASATNGRIRVPTLNFNNSRMAWWVGDQGVKAAIATPPPSGDSALGVIRNNLHSAPRNAVELASSGAIKPFAGLDPEDPRLPGVTSWQQSAHLVADSSAQRPLFHDISAFSTGLLTNVRAGGFRKDLSIKMETYTSAPDLLDPENVLYTVKSPMTGNDEVGINFMELWGYYHLYKELKYARGLNYTTGGSISGNAAYLQTKNSQPEIVNDQWDRFKHPITINYQVIFSFEVAPHPEEDNKNVLWLNFDPVVTLWNPLDVAIDIPKHDRWNYLYSFWVIPYDINIRLSGSRHERVCSFIETSNHKNDANFLRMNAGVQEQLTLKPGEVVKISQEGDTQTVYNRGNGVGSWQGLNGKKGFNYGGGSRLPLLDTSGNRIVVADNATISYSATPNSQGTGGPGNSRRWSLTHTNLTLGGRGATHHGLISVDDIAGYERVQVGEVRDRNSQGQVPNLFDIEANDGDKYIEVYPKIEGPTMTRELSAGALINDKATFMIHSYSVKTEEENISGSRMLSRFNPRAYSLNFYDLSKQERDMMPFEAEITGLTTWFDAPLDESTNGQGYYGSSLATEFGSNYVSTHSVPRQPIVSLAAFQHSFANGFNMASKPSITNTSASLSYPLLPQISHAIGNSLAPSVMESDETTSFMANSPHPLADHSYLANRELWDDYFLSGIAPQPTPAFSVQKDQKTVAREFFEDGKKLPVARYLPSLGGTDATVLVNSLFSRAGPKSDAVNKVASYLRVDGMFNVNSTSVEAWKTLLGSLKDRPIVVRDENGKETIAPKDGNTPVASSGAPIDVIIEDDAAPEAEQWYGRRTLTDDEIESLAQGIVKEVRKRGPFLSLADFVNRRVGSDKKLARAGAIQSALDSEDVTINEKQNMGRAVNSTAANRFAFPEAEEGAMNYGAPSIVKQGDILTPIAPVLSARSDSFIIRSFGESLDNNGNVLAQAWCEAVVERNRDYIDPADDPETITSDLTMLVNQNFGRRFNIVSFRWLNPREI